MQKKFYPLMLSYFPQMPFPSLSPFSWATQLLIYTACSAAAKEEGLVTVKTELVSCQGNVTQPLFKCVSCMLPWLAHRSHTALSVRTVANSWYFHLVVHSGGIIILWGRPSTFARMYSSVGMCTEAVTMKQLTCCKFTSCGLLFVYSDQNAKSCNLSLE